MKGGPLFEQAIRRVILTAGIVTFIGGCAPCYRPLHDLEGPKVQSDPTILASAQAQLYSAKTTRRWTDLQAFKFSGTVVRLSAEDHLEMNRQLVLLLNSGAVWVVHENAQADVPACPCLPPCAPPPGKIVRPATTPAASNAPKLTP